LAYDYIALKKSITHEPYHVCKY